MLLTKKVKLHYKLPKFDNNGKAIPGKTMQEVKNFFITKYGGLSVDSPSEGYWEDGGFVFKDVNLEYSVFIPKQKFDGQVKKEISVHVIKFKNNFRQLAILCYYHDVMST